MAEAFKILSLIYKVYYLVQRCFFICICEKKSVILHRISRNHTKKHTNHEKITLFFPYYRVRVHMCARAGAKCSPAFRGRRHLNASDVRATQLLLQRRQRRKDQRPADVVGSRMWLEHVPCPPFLQSYRGERCSARPTLRNLARQTHQRCRSVFYA